MAKRTYKIDVYDSLLTISNDHDAIDLDPDYKEVDCCMIGTRRGKFDVVIYLTSPCLRTACHESVHAAYSLLDKLSVNIDNDNQEPLAWLTDYVFSKCQDFIDRTKWNG